MEEICEINMIHEDTINNVKNMMPEDGLIYDIADALELSHDELLNKKDMQKKALNSIRRLEM